jgi:hypothetical protein
MTEQADKRICINAPANSTVLVQAFVAKHRIIEVCQHPYRPNLFPYYFWVFSNVMSPLKARRLVNSTVTQYTSSVNGVSLLID